MYLLPYRTGVVLLRTSLTATKLELDSVELSLYKDKQKPIDYVCRQLPIFWFLNHLCNISFHLSSLGTSETLYFLSYNATNLELISIKLSL